MPFLCEYCKKEFISSKPKRFCHFLCQRKHYNRRPEIREKYKLRMREFRRTHPEWREKHRIQQAKYKERRKIYGKEYFQREYVRRKIKRIHKWRLRNDPEFAIAERLRKALRHALKRYTETGKIKSSRKYGINWGDVIEHLKPFPRNIKDYEIDHIIPLRTFDLKKDAEVKKAFSPKNLQWLTIYENRSKGGEVIV